MPSLPDIFRPDTSSRRCARWTRLGVALALAAFGTGAPADDFSAQRLQLIRAIEQDVRETSAYIGKASLNPRVMEVMASVPRHEFVPDKQISHAYENRPLSIGYGQTISQPYIVALMTDLLDVGPEDIVLEVGTGSGYQAAVLADMVRRVYTIEIVEPLARQAKRRFKRLGYDNVSTRLSDGYYGWQEHSPFDAIIVTAASGHIPPPLIAQLKPGARMIIPVGERFQVQHLVIVEKLPDERVRTRQVLPVRFVPLTGNH